MEMQLALGWLFLLKQMCNKDISLNLLACNFERGASDGVWQSDSSCEIQEVKDTFVNLWSYYYNDNKAKFLWKKSLENQLQRKII